MLPTLAPTATGRPSSDVRSVRAGRQDSARSAFPPGNVSRYHTSVGAYVPDLRVRLVHSKR